MAKKKHTVEQIITSFVSSWPQPWQICYSNGVVPMSSFEKCSTPAFDPKQTSSLWRLEHQPKNSTAPVSRLYIAPVILIVPLASSSASTGLSFRMFAIVISTFLRATASTKW